MGQSKSEALSLKTFRKEGGHGKLSSAILNATPWAWPGPWYGSWPNTTTFTSSGFVHSKTCQI